MFFYSESEDGGDEGAGIGGIAAPPSYAQVSSQFGSLESFAEPPNNDEAAYHLQKVRTRSSKPSLSFQTSAAADIRGSRERMMSLASKL